MPAARSKSLAKLNRNDLAVNAYLYPSCEFWRLQQDETHTFECRDGAFVFENAVFQKELSEWLEAIGEAR